MGIKRRCRRKRKQDGFQKEHLPTQGYIPRQKPVEERLGRENDYPRKTKDSRRKGQDPRDARSSCACG